MEIKVTIDKETWQVKLEAIGYTGMTCLSDLGKITSMIGGKVIEAKPKPEMYLVDRVRIK